MADKTKIEWTDATANVINGCSLASPGCTNCYAMKQAHRFPVRQGLTKKTQGGMVWTGEVRFHEPALLKVLSWRRPRMIFWNAHGDMFHPDVPDEWIDRCFAVMALTPQHIHQVLTKRSARMREYFSAPMLRQQMRGDHVREINRSGLNPRKGCTPDAMFQPYPLPNVWLGVSVEDQARADERIPDLLDTPAALRWLSCEPLLGPVDLRRFIWPVCKSMPARFRTWDEAEAAGQLTYKRQALVSADAVFLDWIVAGGESGPAARGSTEEVEANMRSLRDQCAAADVPFFGKQNFKKLPLPEDLLVRQMPKVLA